MREYIQKKIAEYLLEKYQLETPILIDTSKNESADFSVNTALQCGKKLGKKPMELAEEMRNLFLEDTQFSEVKIEGAGFLLFTVSQNSLINLLTNTDSWGNGSAYEGKNIMVEFAHPNTHKAFHIGHLRNITLGESLVRLLESQGAKVIRANYQGDIGPHVAKCIWGMKSTPAEEMEKIKTSSSEKKAEFLGKVYARGGKAYEAEENAKQEIIEINKALYAGNNAELMKLYNESRAWSLEYFESIYKRLHSRFDHYFFESEVWKRGKELVEKNKGTIFTVSNGATVYEGEKVGLHTRVFISSEGNPTYEAKEMGLAEAESKVFPFDECVHIVANEQDGYFKVVIQVISELFPELKGKEKHISYGMVKLSTGKMSSRTGDVITAEWLIEEAKGKIREILSTRDLTTEEKESIAEHVGIGALKFALLHHQSKNDIAFDLQNAVRLDGDSGPYIQYAYSRIQSILQKTSSHAEIKADYTQMVSDDFTLLRKIQHFPYIVERCSKELTTHHLTHYLLSLCADFSYWYGVQSVQNASTEHLKQARRELLTLLGKTIKKGLFLLGIQQVNAM